MLYCSWDMVCDRCNYFSFWAIFCPFNNLTARKIKLKKTKWKKHLEISSVYTSVPKIMIISYFLPFTTPAPPLSNSPKNKNEKNEKNPWRYHHFPYVYQNYDQMMYSTWDMVHNGQMDGRTDGKSDILRWVPHLKNVKKGKKEQNIWNKNSIKFSKTSHLNIFLILFQLN